MTTVIGPADFQALRTALRQRTGISLDEGKQYLVETRLAPIQRARGMELGEIVARFVRGAPAALVAEVIDAMTTNETSFFRDIHPFEAVRCDVLPRVLEHNRARRSLRILSAASSTGQESYTLAMVLRTHFPQLSGWDVRILGVDLSSTAVERARLARYSSLEVNRGLPASMLRWFRQDGRDFVVQDALRAWCDFEVFNLVDPWTRLSGFDLILLRNVLIYFDRTTREQVLRQAVRALAPGGSILLGASETIIGLDVPLAAHRHGSTALLRPGPRKAAA